MFLKSIEYSQYVGTPRFWKLEGCTLGHINLIVGKNATGKSRTLNVINGMANLLAGEDKLHYLSGNYSIEFDNNDKNVSYILHYENKSIISEGLTINSVNKLQRGEDGVGRIYYEKESKQLDFQIPTNELAVVARRDTLQHPFLEDLFNWGKHARLYRFGGDLGKACLMALLKDERSEQILNPKDTNVVIAMFTKGNQKYANKFEQAIIKDMNAIGYSIKEIGTRTPESIKLQENNLPAEPVVLYVKEADLECTTDQIDMSQGMFRALSLIIQIHYSLFTGTPSCILIDDIGEGLDFERSTALVKLLIERAKNSSVQLIMATNDRFVMNNVPLEYWLVIKRVGGICKIYNQRNSPGLFDDFKLTGLNNFDFFTSEYYLKGNSLN